MLCTGAKELIHTAAADGIPMSIFSAGVTPIIGEIIRQETGLADVNGMSSHCIAIIANDVVWAEDRTVKVFVPPLIHSMNKHEIPLECNAKVKACLDRLLSHERGVGENEMSAPRFLVIGDTPSDSLMADVMVDYWNSHARSPEARPPVVLRVGILSKYEPDSDEIQAVIQEYLQHFDIVITGDGPMDLVNEIVKDVLSHSN